MLLSYMADGSQAIIAMVIWPIFIWLVLQGSYQAVGIVSSLIILATIVLRLILGDYVDRFDKKKMLRYGTNVTSPTPRPNGWRCPMLRSLSTSPWFG